MKKHAIAIHGGAGTITRSGLTPELEAAYKAALTEAIEAGDKILAEGGNALDAITESVRVMENNELFNAGKGSVFNHEGKHEMDAAIMDGKTLMAGAVSGIRNLKNPVLLAKAIMEKSEHVLLANSGAADFAKDMGLEFAPDEYFFVQHRYDQLLVAREEGQIVLDHTTPGDEKKFGTVGAVALDIHGNIAAATSTGGMTNKRWGRVGDSPIIGAGTYANNNTCAISCTGHGEYFIRSVVAYDISCLMEYKGLSLKEACEHVVMKKLVTAGGEGGLIAIDTSGNIEMPFNSEGMYRAMKRSGEDFFIGIYND
ncbi:MAG: isoaspartyl peptidase [Bacteroidetes bacterium]|nr:isoaspartyl peptidase [Bacteroidota bacterium]